MRVQDLVPGDRVRMKGGNSTAIFVARTRHPLYNTLQLVIWWLETDQRWSFDALDLRQHLPMTTLGSIHDRHDNLRKVLLGK